MFLCLFLIDGVVAEDVSIRLMLRLVTSQGPPYPSIV